MDLRGQVISVINLRSRLGFVGESDLNKACIIVFEINNNWISGVVDSVSSVLDLKVEEIEMRPQISDRRSIELVMGIARQHNLAYYILDIHQLVATGSLAAA
jgi:purine-binding chemotaxis protein CheW